MRPCKLRLCGADKSAIILAMAKQTHTIRPAHRDDLPALTAIYNHYVINTAVTFDTLPFLPEQRSAWFQQFAPDTRHQLLVLCEGQSVMGYASSAPLRPKQAYDTSVETTIYLNHEATGRGYGKALYGALLELLSHEDVHRCYGIIALPNDASIALHRSLGFKQVAQLNEVGHKFDRYWDTVWLEKHLS